jgi:hypothetical protein
VPGQFGQKTLHAGAARRHGRAAEGQRETPTLGAQAFQFRRDQRFPVLFEVHQTHHRNKQDQEVEQQDAPGQG